MQPGTLRAVLQPRALFLDPGRQDGVVAGRQRLAERGDPGLQAAFLVGAQHRLLGDGRTGVVAAVAVEPRVAERIEVGVELVVVLLADRVELVVVALRAGEGQAQDGFAQRLHAVRVVVEQVLRGDRATLVGVHVVALEARRDQLGVRRVRHEVAGELLEQEAVVGLVVVEGLDDPVAPEPEVATAVDGEAIGVGVAGRIEPVQGHALAEVRRGQQAVDLLLVGAGRGVLEEGVELLGRGREPGQVERHAPQQRRAVGLAVGLEAAPAQALVHERVDRRAPEIGGQGGPMRRQEGPVVLVLGALLEPGLHLRLVVRRELEVRLRRRHDVVLVVAGDARPDFALLDVARHDRDAGLVFLEGVRGQVQAQLRLAGLLIRAVAGEAVLREDGADVAVVAHLLGREHGQG